MYPEWYYSDVVLFVDDELTKIFKAPIKTGDYLYTSDLDEIIN